MLQTHISHHGLPIFKAPHPPADEICNGSMVRNQLNILGEFWEKHEISVQNQRWPLDIHLTWGFHWENDRTKLNSVFSSTPCHACWMTGGYLWTIICQLTTVRHFQYGFSVIVQILKPIIYAWTQDIPPSCMIQKNDK